MIAKLYPYLIMVGEALLAGVGVGYGTYSATHDLRASLVAGIGAAVTKILPSQVTPSPAPKA
jgi:hypothetical protein